MKEYRNIVALKTGHCGSWQAVLSRAIIMLALAIFALQLNYSTKVVIGMKVRVLEIE